MGYGTYTCLTWKEATWIGIEATPSYWDGTNPCRERLEALRENAQNLQVIDPGGFELGEGHGKHYHAQIYCCAIGR
jgi:hypothetical protein